MPSADPSQATADEWRSTWADESAAERRGPGPRHPAAAALRAVQAAESRVTRSGSVTGHDHDVTADGDGYAEASEYLVRRLRGRQLTSREARDALRAQGVPAEEREQIVTAFEERGYLDDANLAEHLVISGSQRKGQGRVAIARTLRERGIPPEVADEALSVLEDDDAERALEYARSKIAGLRRYDEDTAVRRLVGQLSRRGYGGSVAMNAARTAWRETQRGSGAGRVRFEES